jgi:protein kinase A
MVAGYPPFYNDDPMKLYANILQCKPLFTKIFDANCKDLINNLVTADLSKRFGHLVGGVSDIKQHAWFEGLDWIKLLNCQIEAPYIPPVKSDADATNFDVYDEDFEPYGCSSQKDDPYTGKFNDF